MAFTMWACFLLVSASLVHWNPWHHLTDHACTSLLLLHKSYNKLYRFHQCPPVMHSFVKPLHKVLPVEISTSVMFPPHVGLHILPPNLKIQPLFIWHWDSCFFFSWVPAGRVHSLSHPGSFKDTRRSSGTSGKSCFYRVHITFVISLVINSKLINQRRTLIISSVEFIHSPLSTIQHNILS